MPLKTPAQVRLFQAAAHDPAVAKRTGISQDVAQESLSKTPHTLLSRAAKTRPTPAASLEKQRAQARALRNQD
jgi:hypothetical protein